MFKTLSNLIRLNTRGLWSSYKLYFCRQTLKSKQVRHVVPVTREILDARSEGVEPVLVPVKAPAMEVLKHYKQARMGSPAYKTQVRIKY